MPQNSKLQDSSPTTSTKVQNGWQQSYSLAPQVHTKDSVYLKAKQRYCEAQHLNSRPCLKQPNTLAHFPPPYYRHKPTPSQLSSFSTRLRVKITSSIVSCCKGILSSLFIIASSSPSLSTDIEGGARLVRKVSESSLLLVEDEE